MKLTRLFILTQMLATLMLPMAHAADGLQMHHQRAGINLDKTPAPPKPKGIGLLSDSSYFELSQLNQDHEMRSNYGLLDRDEDALFYQSQSDRRGGLMSEMLHRQVDERLRILRANLEMKAGDSPAAKSAIILAAAYLIYNGKAVTTKLTDSAELSARAKAADRTGSVQVDWKNLSPLNLNSGVAYQMDSADRTITASLSKEILPHVTASVDQKHSLASGSTPTEHTGSLSFGTSF